jgi:hypothetical protein
MSNGFKTIWKEAAVAQFKVISIKALTVENHEISK